MKQGDLLGETSLTETGWVGITFIIEPSSEGIMKIKGDNMGILLGMTCGLGRHVVFFLWTHHWVWHLLPPL